MSHQRSQFFVLKRVTILLDTFQVRDLPLYTLPCDEVRQVHVDTIDPWAQDGHFEVEGAGVEQVLLSWESWLKQLQRILVAVNPCCWLLQDKLIHVWERSVQGWRSFVKGRRPEVRTLVVNLCLLELQHQRLWIQQVCRKTLLRSIMPCQDHWVKVSDHFDFLEFCSH